MYLIIWTFLKPADSVLFKEHDISSPLNFRQYAVYAVLPHNIEMVL